MTITYNSAEALRLHWTTPPPNNVEWIVVDSKSTDASVKVANQCGASSVLSQPANRGFSAASNIGLRHATGRFIAFVNPDVTIDFSSLSKLSQTIEAQDVLVGPQLVSIDGALQPNGRGLPTLWNKISNRIRTIDTENGYYRFAAPDEEKYVCWLIGAAVCGRRQTFERLGGWDEWYFVYYEDADRGLEHGKQESQSSFLAERTGYMAGREKRLDSGLSRGRMKYFQ